MSQLVIGCGKFWLAAAGDLSLVADELSKVAARVEVLAARGLLLSLAEYGWSSAFRGPALSAKDESGFGTSSSRRCWRDFRDKVLIRV